MKNTFLKTFLFITFISATLSSCINSDVYDNIDTACVTVTPTKTVADIYAMATSQPQLYEGDDIIEAYVTSSDAGGTFYKSLSMVSIDGTKAFSIPIDMYNIYTEYEPGRKVYVYLKGRHFNITFGSLIIGDLYVQVDANGTERISVGRLQPEAMRNTIKASCESITDDELVQHFTIADALNNNQINKLIQIDNVQFGDEALSNNYYNPSNVIGGATNISIVDENGKKMIFRTSEFADFANVLVATGRGSIRGVLTKYNSDFQFLARTIDDIQFNDPRLVPVFEETFTNNFPLWTKISLVGAQVWTLDTQYGNPGSCAKMSGFASGNKENEDWLISPSINLSGTTAASLTFDTATKFAGNTLEILISADYSGSGTPTAATWTTVTATLSPSSGSYVWTNSGKIDLSDFAGGNVYVAFKYTSTTSAAATWEVDNVKVTTN